MALAAALAAAACLGRGAVRGAEAGIAAAGAASSASTAWLLSAREMSPRAFWHAFGGGMALRAGAAAALAGWAWRRPEVSLAAALLSYAFVLTGLQLFLDFKFVRQK